MFFDAIIGHEAQIDSLRKRIRGGTLPHALLLVGPPGIGKRLVAAALAAARLCEQYPKGPCGECVACRKMKTLSHPDFLQIEPDGRAQSIRIDSVRRIRDKVALKPSEAGGSAVVIDGAGSMNMDAQNAMLKILEEPPSGVLFILIEPELARLLPTVRSRCQTVLFEPLSTGELTGILSGKCGTDREEALRLSELAGGSAERALRLREANFTKITEAMFTLAAVARTGELAPLPDWGKDRQAELACVDILIRIYRDVLILKAGAGNGRLFFPEREQTLARLADGMKLESIEDTLQAAGLAAEQLSESANSKLVFSGLFTEMGIKIVQ